MTATVTLADLDILPHRLETTRHVYIDSTALTPTIDAIKIILQQKGVEWTEEDVACFAQAFFESSICALYDGQGKKTLCYITSLNKKELIYLLYFLKKGISKKD